MRRERGRLRGDIGGTTRENKEICENANGAGGETGSKWRNEACRDGHRRTLPVGTFGSNAWGLHDVLGNVWEWVEDCWHENYEGVPRGGEPWVTGGDCGKRVLRGSSWDDDPRVLRSAFRLGDSPGYRDSGVGFRVAKTLPP